MTDETYCYPPDFTVLRNKFNIRDAATFERAERRVVTNRMQQPLPSGKFDLTHLKSIHGHLFQDVYAWAGETRTRIITKGDSTFIHPRYIGNGMLDVQNQLEKADYLRGRSADDFAAGAGNIIGDVNFIHPFREGNGRTQFIYLRQLGRQAGHDIDLSRIDRDRWIKASIAANDKRYDPMIREIRGSIVQDRTRDTDRDAFKASRQSAVDAVRDKPRDRGR